MVKIKNKTLQKLIDKYNKAKAYNDSIGFSLMGIRVYSKPKKLNPSIKAFLRLYKDCKLNDSKTSIKFIKEKTKISYIITQYGEVIETIVEVV